jgi:hypothetical protein
MQTSINQLLTSQAADQAYLVPYLTWNLTHQVCLGNPQATI